MEVLYIAWAVGLDWHGCLTKSQDMHFTLVAMVKWPNVDFWIKTYVKREKNTKNTGARGWDWMNTILYYKSLQAIYRFSTPTQDFALLLDTSIDLPVFPHQLSSFQVIFLLMVYLIFSIFLKGSVSIIKKMFRGKP